MKGGASCSDYSIILPISFGNLAFLLASGLDRGHSTSAAFGVVCICLVISNSGGQSG